MKLTTGLLAFVIAVSIVLPAWAAPTTPIASKDGTTFSLEDLNVYWLRNLGKDGLLDFFQMMVIYQEGIKQGQRPTAAEVNNYIENSMGRDIYNEFVQLYSETAVRQMVEYTLVGAKYEEWLREKIRRERNLTVTEMEANDFFLENIGQFHLPEGLAISIISVDNQTQADSVLASLANGDDFSRLAGEVNMDPEMRAKNGQLGIYRRGDGLPQPLEDAAFSLSTNSYSEIIKGQNYHIIYCHQRYPEVAPTFADVKEELQQEMLEAKIDEYFFQEISDLMNAELPRFDIRADLFRPEDI